MYAWHYLIACIDQLWPSLWYLRRLFPCLLWWSHGQKKLIPLCWRRSSFLRRSHQPSNKISNQPEEISPTRRTLMFLIPASLTILWVWISSFSCSFAYKVKLLKRMKDAVTFSAQGSIASIFLQGIFKISGGSQFSFLNGGELDLDGWRDVWLLWYDILTTPGSSSVGALKIFGALKYFILGFFFPPSFSFAPPSAFDILAGQQSVIVDSLLER